MTDYCVTSTPTIMDGTVVRWYANQNALEHGSVIVSASRNGVMGGPGAYLTPDLFQAAWDAHQAIAAGQDVAHLATHRNVKVFGREYVQVNP